MRVCACEKDEERVKIQDYEKMKAKFDNGAGAHKVQEHEKVKIPYLRY